MWSPFLELSPGELKKEVRRKTPMIASHRLQENASFDSVETGEVPIQDHLFPTEEEDHVFDTVERHQRSAHLVFHQIAILGCTNDRCDSYYTIIDIWNKAIKC
jgi:hypothetical protein